MPSEIRLVAIIGSGVMGSQIAAQVANAGTPVLLLDIVPKDATDRNMLGKKAMERLMAEPSAFMHPDAAALVTIGNTEDDMDKIKDADWILEAVIEDLKIKSDLYKKIDAIRKPGAIVASNTSTIPLAKLIAGQSEAFAKDFMVTHFFNPVRYMRLLELITGPETAPESRELMARFCDKALGKGVVPCNDTPGFIANRLGMFWLQAGVNAAFDLGLSVEEADEVCGRPMGIPRTGVFGLIDLIGIDLMPLIGKSLLSTLGADDTYRHIYQEADLCKKMIAEGYTGRKGKGGFYRFAKTEKGKVKESINLETGDYAPSVASKIPTLEMAAGNLRTLCEQNDKIGQYAWRVLSETLLYGFNLVTATVPDISLVDEGMRLGYNWKWGPFELIDKVGADWFIQKLKAESRPVPDLLAKAAGKTFYRVEGGKLETLQPDGSYAAIKRAEGVLLLADIKRAGKPVEKNGSAALWDIGDQVLCLEFTSKANALDADIFAMVHRAISLIAGGAWKGLVLHNEADNFSAGANLAFIRDQIKVGNYDGVEAFVRQGQSAMSALRFASFPSVAAPMGAAMGGGCEIALHCSAIQAYCELNIGLVEANVGLIPGWGGCTQMLGRLSAKSGCCDEPCGCAMGGDAPPAANILFDYIMTAKTSKSAADARSLGFLRCTDGITMNKDRLLFDAKQKVLELAAAGYQPPKAWEVLQPGPSCKSSLDVILEAMKASPHDMTIGKLLAGVLCGEEGGLAAPVTESRVMDAEREVFVTLTKTPETLARIEHMLEKGKPLKN